MAKEFEAFPELPSQWRDGQQFLFADLATSNMDMFGDRYLQTLINDIYFDPKALSPSDRVIAMQRLYDYTAEKYDIDFDAAFEWDAYREWYEEMMWG